MDEDETQKPTVLVTAEVRERRSGAVVVVALEPPEMVVVGDGDLNLLPKSFYDHFGFCKVAHRQPLEFGAASPEVFAKETKHLWEKMVMGLE